jgi:hypothetical protein
MSELSIPKHLNPNSSQYKMLMRRIEMNANNNNKQNVAQVVVNSPVMGMTLTGNKETPMGQSVSGMTSQTSGSGMKKIKLDFRYRPKKTQSVSGGRIKLIV